MDKGSKGLTPELARETGLCKHGGDALVQNAVRALSDTVLLGTVACGVLPLDAVRCGEGREGVGHVLPALVVAQDLDPLARLGLSVRLVRLERLERAGLGLQRDHNAETRVVIDEGDPVAEAGVRLDRERALQIGVHKLQRLGRAVRRGRKGGSDHLACETGLARRIWRS